MSKLEGSQFGQIHAALLDAFSVQTLRLMLRIELEQELDAITTPRADLSDCVFELVEWADREDRVEDLIAAALRATPTNTELRALARAAERWFGQPGAGAQDAPPSPEPYTATHPPRLDAVLYDTAEIPYKPPRLVGRDKAVTDVEAALARYRIVLITGLAGMGKTALAAAVAQRTISLGAGSVIWLNCREEQAPDQFEAFDRMAVRHGTADRVQNFAAMAEAAQIEAARDVLACTGAALLVLDDARSADTLKVVLQVVPESMKVIVTSRFRHALPHIMDVSDFSLDAAVQLLALHADDQALLNNPAARALCSKLGSHPYAVEIAGKTLKVEEETPQRLMERIARTSDDGSQAGFSELQQSVFSLLNDSYRSLQPPQQEALKAFGALFAPGASADLIAAASGLPRPDVDEALRSLHQRSLARRRKGTDFYALHDLTFSFAASLAAHTPEQRAGFVTAIAAYVVAHAHDFELLELDQPNILGAADRAQDAELVQMISALTVGGFPQADPPGYFETFGHTAQFLRHLDHAIEIAGGAGDERRELLHHLLSKRGNAYLDIGDPERALASYEAALQTAPTPRRRAVLLAVTGRALALAGRFQDAELRFQEARALAQAEKDQWSYTFTLEQETNVANDVKHDYDRARELAATYIDLAEAAGDREALVTGYLNLGIAELNLGLSRAHALLEKARTIATEQKMNDTAPFITEEIARVHLARFEHSEARAQLKAAIEGYGEIGKLWHANRLQTLMAQFGYK